MTYFEKLGLLVFLVGMFILTILAVTSTPGLVGRYFVGALAILLGSTVFLLCGRRKKD
jgi:hypothetical protein